MRIHVEAVSASTVVIGRSDHDEHYTVFYYDARDVSRIYRMAFDGTAWTQERRDPDFHQRFVGTVADDGNRIDARWEKADPDGEWTHDFDLIYRRASHVRETG